tara:strand:- start:8836 stop:10170 length:1335 start_codon:yes stop_codon:yes gene_type:complete
MESQTPGAELDDSPLNRPDDNLADSTNVVNTINLSVVNQYDDGEVTSWIAAEILKSEIQWRLNPVQIRNFSTDSAFLEHGWISDGDVEPTEVISSDLIKQKSQEADVSIAFCPPESTNRESEEINGLVRLPWLSQSAKKKVDQETLLRLASHWLTPARAEQFNPMVLAETAIVVDLSSEINEVTSNEIARFARSENLTVIALSTSELSEQTFLVRMQSSGVRTERLGLLLSPQQTIGLLAKSSLVISANPQISALALSYHPRVAYLNGTSGTSEQSQRVIQAASFATADQSFFDTAENALDALAEVVENIALIRFAKKNKDNHDVDTIVNERKNESRARNFLSARLEKERLLAAKTANELRKRVKGLAEQRDLAELEVRRLEANLESQTNHLNNLELRIADYDQGPVLRTRLARMKAVVVVVENELVVILSKLRLYVKSWLRNN